MCSSSNIAQRRCGDRALLLALLCVLCCAVPDVRLPAAHAPLPVAHISCARRRTHSITYLG